MVVDAHWLLGTTRILSNYCFALVLAFTVGCQEKPTKFATSQSSRVQAPTTQVSEQQPGNALPAVVDHSLREGLCRFNGRVRSSRVFEYDVKEFNGIGEIQGNQFIIVGTDARWLLEIEVDSVETPVWFLQPGRPAKFVVHSPTHVFGEGKVPYRENRRFEFSISRGDGKGDPLLLGHLTASRLSQKP